MAKSAGFVNPTVKKSIETAGGTAYYLRTEIEDSLGRWNDNYYINDGYWVIHDGNQHHVYKVGQKGKGMETKIREILDSGWSAMNISSQIANVTNIPQPKVLQIIQDNHWDRDEIIKALVSKKGKGWHENPDRTGKAPVHKEVATRAQVKQAQNKPMKKKETLFDKWVAYLKRIDPHGRGFEVFDWSSRAEGSVEELEKILNGGQLALDDYINELQDMNFEYQDSMFDTSFEEFLKDEGIDKDSIENEEEFRFEFEGHINYNVGTLFSFDVLLLEKKHYEVSYDGASSEIDETDSEGNEFKKKALKYITEKQFNSVLANSYGGAGYFGIIIIGSEIIEAIQKGEKSVSDNQLVVGIHDWFNGAGYFERAIVKPNYEIPLNNAMLDTDSYGIGAVFGTSEWKWR